MYYQLNCNIIQQSVQSNTIQNSKHYYHTVQYCTVGTTVGGGRGPCQHNFRNLDSGLAVFGVGSCSIEARIALLE